MVMLTPGERGGSVSGAWSVDVGGVSMGRRGNRAGTGSASVTVHGAVIGFLFASGSARGGATECEASQWESETSVRCLIGRGVQGSRRVVVTTGGRSGSASGSLSFDNVVAHYSIHRNCVGTGSSSLTVYGTGIGQSSSTTHLRLASTDSEATDWWSQSAIRCLSVGGEHCLRGIETWDRDAASCWLAPRLFGVQVQGLWFMVYVLRSMLGVEG
jgi:hypothetical protein